MPGREGRLRAGKIVRQSDQKNQKHAAALGRWAQDMPSSQRRNADTSTIDRRDAPQATLFTAALIVTPDMTSINLIRASRLMHVIDVRGHEHDDSNRDLQLDIQTFQLTPTAVLSDSASPPTSAQRIIIICIHQQRYQTPQMSRCRGRRVRRDGPRPACQWQRE